MQGGGPQWPLFFCISKVYTTDMQYIRKLINVTPAMDAALREAVEQEAIEKGRSTNYSNLVREILAEGLRARGYMKAKK